MKRKRIITQTLSPKYLDKLISENRGYSQIPNFIFLLGLSKHALLVLIYLIRCVNLKKGRICFPSKKDIRKKCSIPSETTVRAAIQELIDLGLLSKEIRGRKNVYTICETIYVAIDIANGIVRINDRLKDIASYSDAIKNEESEYASVERNSDDIQSEYNEIRTHSDDEYHHHVLPNNTKGTRLINNIKKEEEQNSKNPNFERVSIDRNESTKGNKISLAEANQYYQSLAESDKTSFDIAARVLIRSDEADPQNSLVSKRTVRRRFYELLKQEPKRHDGFENYYV